MYGIRICNNYFQNSASSIKVIQTFDLNLSKSCLHTSESLLIASSVAEPEPPGAATFRAEPETILLGRSREPEPPVLRRLRLRLHLLGMQKRKALYLCFVSVWSRSRQEPPFFAWSRRRPK